MTAPAQATLAQLKLRLFTLTTLAWDGYDRKHEKIPTWLRLEAPSRVEFWKRPNRHHELFTLERTEPLADEPLPVEEATFMEAED